MQAVTVFKRRYRNTPLNMVVPFVRNRERLGTAISSFSIHWLEMLRLCFRGNSSNGTTHRCGCLPGLSVLCSLFTLHDEDLWMFALFNGGKIATQFNPIPDYWSENLAEDEIRSWQGDASVVAACVPGLKPEAITRYLKRWDFDSDQGEKAYADDRFTYLDCFQVIDFMKRIRLSFPVDREGNCVGTTFEFIVPEKSE